MRKKVFSIFFLILLISPLLFMNHKKNFASELDNRYLTEINIDTNIDNLTKNISEYFQDRIGFRYQSAELFSWFNDKLFHYISNPLYKYGKNDYIFASNQGVSFDESYMNSFIGLLDKIDKYTENRNIEFYFMLNPTKTKLLNEFVSHDRLLTFPKENFLVDNLEKRDINFINSETAMINSPYPTFNKKYDPNHWNNYGAFVATNQLLKSIQTKFPTIQLNDSSNYTLKSKIEEVLPESVFKINDEVNYLNLRAYYTINHVDLADEIEIDQNFHYVTYSINNSVSNSIRALVFRGSYYITDKMEDKFITPAFKETLFIHNYSNLLNYEYYINLFQPDIVIFETVEYTIGEYFFSQYAMDNKKLESNLPPIISLNLFETSVNILNEKTEIISSLKLDNGNFIKDLEFYISKDKNYSKIIGFSGDSRIDFFIEDLGDRYRIYASILESQLKDNSLKIYFIDEENKLYSETQLMLLK